jgi:hypothetical protein
LFAALRIDRRETMPETPIPMPTSATPEHQRVELANQLFREFRTQCFWHSPQDLVITEEVIPFVVKGLRSHGGRRGFILAGQLEPKGGRFPDRESPQCR